MTEETSQKIELDCRKNKAELWEEYMNLLEQLGYKRLDLPEGWKVSVSVTEGEISDYGDLSKPHRYLHQVAPVTR